MRKVVHSIAFVLEDRDRILFVYRNNQCIDYRNFWSLPSTSVTQIEWTNAVEHNTFSNEIIEKFEKRIGIKILKVQLLIKGERERQYYHLYQAVFLIKEYAILQGNYPRQKYSKMDFMTPEEVLLKQNALVGTCISLYFTYLIQHEVLPTTFRYYEIDPVLIDNGLDVLSQSPQFLWEMASQNYKLLMEGKTGTEGSDVREISLNRYIAKLLENVINAKGRFLDVGCGDGSLVRYLLSNGVDAWGAEIGNAVMPEISDRVYHCDVVNINNYVKNRKFDVVLANLLIEWTEDLISVFKSLLNVLSNDGVIIATVTPPEYQRSGRWIKGGEQYHWLKEKCAHRPKELVMINRCVGPLWFFPRSSSDITQDAYNAGLLTERITDIYVDSYLEEAEINKVKAEFPYLFAQRIVPLFSVFEFCKNPRFDRIRE